MLAGTRAEVLAHFTDPELFSRWFVVDCFTTPAASIVLDARSGGSRRCRQVRLVRDRRAPHEAATTASTPAMNPVTTPEVEDEANDPSDGSACDGRQKDDKDRLRAHGGSLSVYFFDRPAQDADAARLLIA